VSLHKYQCHTFALSPQRKSPKSASLKSKEVGKELSRTQRTMQGIFT